MNRCACRLAVGVGLTLLDACSGPKSDNPMPPGNAGTAAVHAKWTAGPCSEAGRCAGQGAMGGSEIVLLRLASGQRTESRTNRHGDAVFRVAPGRYEARFPNRYEARFPNNVCPGEASIARFRVMQHATSHAEIVCTAP